MAREVIPVHENNGLGISYPLADSQSKSSKKNGGSYVSPIKIDNRWGLLDPSDFLSFIDSDKCLYLSTPWGHNNCHEEVHHGLFPRKLFKRKTTPLVLKHLRSNRLNLFEMQSCQEELYHQRRAPEVPLEDIDQESASWFLEESGWIRDYAATSQAFANAQAGTETASQSLTRAQKDGLLAKAFLLQEINYQALHQVGKIEVVSPMVATGALLKYADRTGETTMLQVVKDRLSSNPESIPTKAHKEEHLNQVADTLLRRKIAASSWGVRKLFETSF